MENVIIKDVELSSVKSIVDPIFEEGSRIAVLNFRSPDDTQGGILVSDMFASLLRSEGYQVYERDEIEKILGEQQLIMEDRVAVSDLDIADKLGKLEAIDYMVFGAVTLYNSSPQSVYLPLRIVEEDRIKYAEQYDLYKDWYMDHVFPFTLDYFREEEEREKILHYEEGVVSLADLEDVYEKYSRQEYRVIASVGISAKVVDVKTGKLIWTGQAETLDFTLVGGAKRILVEFQESIQERTR